MAHYKNFINENFYLPFVLTITIDINLNILCIDVNNRFRNYDTNGVIVPGKSVLLWQNFEKLGMF
jgi:hypothetical protein